MVRRPASSVSTWHGLFIFGAGKKKKKKKEKRTLPAPTYSEEKLLDGQHVLYVWHGFEEPTMM